MVNYQNGKIYKIISNQTDKIYIGSTTKLYLSQRMGRHISDYKRYLKNGKRYVSSFEIIKYDDCSIILIENYPCKTKDELRAREQYYIDQIDCVNKINAFGISNESLEHTKQYRKTYGKKWHEENKEKIEAYKEKKKQNDKRYREKNKELIAQKKKEWYEQHKDEFNERRRLIYQQQKKE